MAGDDGDCDCGESQTGMVPLHEQLGWRWDLDEVETAITPTHARDLRELAQQPERRRA